MNCKSRRATNHRFAGPLAIVALLVAATGLSPGRAEPVVPMEGELIPDRVTVDVGKAVAFRLALSVGVPLGRVRVRLKVPEGMTLVGGTAEAEIAGFAPGQDREFEYQLRLDQPGEKKVWVEAEVLGIAPSIMRRNVLAVVNPADDTQPKPTIRRDPDGTTYQVQGVSPKQPP